METKCLLQIKKDGNLVYKYFKNGAKISLHNYILLSLLKLIV